MKDKAMLVMLSTLTSILHLVQVLRFHSRGSASESSFPLYFTVFFVVHSGIELTSHSETSKDEITGVYQYAGH